MFLGPEELDHCSNGLMVVNQAVKKAKDENSQVFQFDEETKQAVVSGEKRVQFILHNLQVFSFDEFLELKRKRVLMGGTMTKIEVSVVDATQVGDE